MSSNLNSNYISRICSCLFRFLDQKSQYLRSSRLPPPQLVEEIVLLATEEAPVAILVGELAPKVEATKARGKGEEEGSSSTPGKEENEGNIASDEDQHVDATGQQVEDQYDVQEPIEVQESVLERDYEVTPIKEDEVQIIPPPETVQH